MKRHTTIFAAVLACLTVNWIGSDGAAAVLPYSGTDLRLWLRADAGMTLDTVTHPDRVLGWADQTGIGGNTTAQDGVGPGGARPLWRDNRIGGRPTLWFDNTSRRIDGPAVLTGGNAARTIFVVGTSDAAGNNIFFDPNGQGTGTGAILFRITPEINIRFNNGFAGFGNPMTPGQPTILTAGLPTGGQHRDAIMYKDGAPLTNLSSSTNPIATGTAGYRMGTANYKGEIAEVMAFDALLSAGEIDAVGYYLQQKYGIAGSFTTAATNVFFDDLDPADSDWWTPGNWDIAAEPTAAQDAFIGGGATAVVSRTGEVANAVHVGHNQGTPSGTATLRVTGGSLTTNALNLGNDGQTGNVRQDAGTITANGDLTFGAVGNRGGTYNFFGGTLNVTGNIQERVPGVDGAQFHLDADLDGGAATLNVAGSITTQRFAVGQNSGRTGTLTLPVGKSLTTTGTLAVGSSGNGTFTLDGGTLSVANSVIGEGGAGVGTVNLNSSTMAATSYVVLGINGTGTVNVDGGNMTVGGRLTVGRSGKGTLNLIDGTVTVGSGLMMAENAAAAGAKAATLVIGDGSTNPTLNVSGGNFETAQAGEGHVTMNSGTFNQNTANIIVGQAATADATFTLNGGVIDVENQLRVGNTGKGLFTQNGGTVNVGTKLDLANSPAGDGTYVMNGGVLSVGDRVKSNLVIGNNNTAAAKALFNLVDGVMTVSNGIRIADNGVNSSGTLILGDGTTNPTVTINGQFESADNGTGTFTFNSGTLTQTAANFITGQAVNSVSTVTIGGGTTPATYNLDGGDGARDWNTNAGHGIVSVLANGTVNVGRNMNLGNNTDADSGLELTIDGGTVNVGTRQAAGGRIIYRNNGPRDQIDLVDGVLNLNGGSIELNNAAPSQFRFTGGRLEDVGRFVSTLVQEGGTLAPGNSPGTTVITGGYDLDAGIYEVEISGLAQGADPGYDFLDVGGNANLGDGVLDQGNPDSFLQILLDPGFQLSLGDTFDVLSAADVTLSIDFMLDQSLTGLTGGGFVHRVIPDGNGEILQLQFVPEPTSIWLALVGMLCLAAFGGRRRGRGFLGKSPCPSQKLRPPYSTSPAWAARR